MDAAHAQANAVLACQGTVTYEAVILEGEVFGMRAEDDAGKKQEKISMGISVNFTDPRFNGNRTVEGTFGSIGERLRSWREEDPQPLSWLDNPHEVYGWDETSVLFSSTQGKTSIDGIIDRITGDARIRISTNTMDTIFELKCKPTQRVF